MAIGTEDNIGDVGVKSVAACSLVVVSIKRQFLIRYIPDWQRKLITAD